jgi:hypothetical protein
VTCSETDVVPAHGFRTIRLTVAVDASADGSAISSFQISGGGAASASTVDPTTITATPPGFGVDAFDGQVTDFAGAPSTQAAGHPFAASMAFDLNTITNPNPPFGPLWPVEPTKDVLIDLPAGLIAQRDAAHRPGREDGEDETCEAAQPIRRRSCARRAGRMQAAHSAASQMTPAGS